MPESTNADETVTVWCRLPRGLSLMERSGMGADAATKHVRLQPGCNLNVPRAFLERFVNAHDPKLSIRRVPILGYIIESKTK